ncbi:DUF4129 domain-containing transglutaminase family protein [Virgibacillus ndiopensis]|uniref:DUF4129 domain-containing transglutaminase family protein n=1 Tax=Virgibacillus ndiopensis TaxID=2004408 RepID=UPI001FE60D8D|nr:transglutaminase domain-containing protein [Virgibacillus ndiopensis]
MKWWFSFLLKGFALVFIMNSLFMTTYPFLSKLWFKYIFMEISFNINGLFNQEWYELTPLFRSFLFLLLIWLMSYLLHYWFVIMKRIFLFVLFTIIYLTVLDTFTVYDADGAIVRTFIISFVSLGMANLFKEIDRESIRFVWTKKSSIWIFPLIAVVLFSSLVGYAAPKYDPQWPDPVPFLKSAAENAGGSDISSTVRRVGYGEDDSKLGGSFVQDYTPVFQAAVKEEHYWRIETKDVYTGKGWKRSADPNYETQVNGYIELDTFSDNVKTEEHDTVIEFQGNNVIEKLIYPYGINQVEAREATSFLLDQNSGEIRTQVNNVDRALAQYRITYDMPSFAIDKLRKVSLDDPSEINDQYTQLPENLPARIGELAKEITASGDNRYDKVRAVENYFGQNGFQYQTNDVPIPKENQDYVDQFLFESKVGYCDNYSTSMVVLLRTLDIPARWVKGFTSGEKVAENIGGTDESYDVYEVTNANAHSWVEAYFPEYGWVPFEPTQGFSNLTDFEINLDNVDEQDDTLEAPEQEKPEKKMEKEEEKDTAPVVKNNTIEKLDINWGYVAIGFTVFIILAFLLYRKRYHIKAIILSMRFRSKHDAKTYQDAYHYLLQLLSYNGLSRNPNQTLREYAKRIDSRYSSDEMGHLTDYYERMLYNNEISETETKKLTQLWKNLIKRIMA